MLFENIIKINECEMAKLSSYLLFERMKNTRIKIYALSWE